MEYVIPAVIVVLLAAGFVAFLAFGATRTGRTVEPTERERRREREREDERPASERLANRDG